MRASRLVAPLLAVLACTGEGETAPDASATADTGVAAAQPTSEVVQVTLTEWSVQLDADSVPAGAVSFQISNRGEVVHTFEIQGEGEEWSVEAIVPGEDATLRVDMAAGVYDVFCPIVNGVGSHEARGMRAQLVAVPAGN